MKAGALFIAVVVSFIIAVLCSSFILYSYYITINFEAISFQQKVNANANSGMQWLLTDDELVELNGSMHTDLYGTGEDSVTLSIQPWGGFYIYKSIARTDKFTSKQIALTGYNYFENNDAALYLQDLNVPLSITGNTFLKGTAYLPESGIKVAYIEGIGYDGKQMIYGTRKISSEKLPGLNLKLEQNLTQMWSNKWSELENITNISEGELPEKIVQSFDDTTLIFYSEKLITISSGQFSGNVEVVSSKGIIVGKEANLTDVLLIAPYIFIESEFTGSLQLFAKDSIRIGNNVKLNYPSVAGIYQPAVQDENTYLDVGENTQVSGVVFAYTKNPPVDNRLRLILNKNSIVSGELYCNSFIDLKGSVYGSVTCSKFTLKTPSSVYENHLLNATIDRSRINPDFVSVSLVNNLGNKQIVKWLK